MMKTKQSGVPERLLKLAADIAAQGNAELTRLTILKKWFEQPGRLSAFAVWMGRRAISEKREASGEAANLFPEAERLLKELDPMRPVLEAPRLEVARALYDRMREFQNVHRYIHGTPVRMIENWDLMLVEASLGILARNPYAAPTEGYRLAADYCKHYDSRYGDGLNGPSREKIVAIARWASEVEASEV
jgi:hypothetical protein